MKKEELSKAMASPETLDRFKKAFKLFKSRQDPPDLSQIFDTRVPNQCQRHQAMKQESVADVDRETAKACQEFGLVDPLKWKVLTFASGLLIVPNPFTSGGQMTLASHCLLQYPKNPPNRTNLDNLQSKSEEDEPETKKQKLLSFDWSEEARRDPVLIPKLRWATLGYHHNWDTKVYSEEDQSPFPEYLSRLTKIVADCLGFSNFSPQAAIVNYYPMSATLGGHTDHSEPNLDHPLFSISLGQSCVFLIGGETKEEDPLPILLRSGDILVMTERARKAYHAVPRIVQDPIASWLDDSRAELSEADNKFILSYLKNQRINVNIRQLH